MIGVLRTMMLAVLMVFVGPWATGAAWAAPTVPSQIAYVYDAPALPSVLASGHVERGPPLGIDRGTPPQAVDSGSHPASQRASAGASAVVYDYDGMAQFAHIATVDEALSAAGGEPLWLQRSRVAAKTTAGWSRGGDIYALTKAGNKPAWSTVRGRFWKNEAADPQIDNWSSANLDRMNRGLAPQRYNRDKGGLESMDLSHEPIPFRDGGTNLVPRWPQDHAAIDPYRFPGY